MSLEKKIIEVNGKKYKIHASCASSQKTKYQDLGLSVTLRIALTWPKQVTKRLTNLTVKAGFQKSGAKTKGKT